VLVSAPIFKKPSTTRYPSSEFTSGGENGSTQPLSKKNRVQKLITNRKHLFVIST